MKLYEIISSTTWDKVHDNLLFYCEKDLVSLYKKIYLDISNIQPIIDMHKPIHIVIQHLPDKNEPAFDIYGIRNGDSHIYSLSLSLWSEWLGYEIDDNTINLFTPDEILAHCLWEMTYYGISEREVATNRNELLNTTQFLDDTKYVEEKTLCPFCSGSKEKSNKEICTHCNADGFINILVLP